MNEYLLRDGEDHELRFNGELVIEQTRDIAFEDQYTRRFVARVYAVTGDGFVSSLEYQTTSESEAQINLIEAVDVMEEVEKFFYVFEPDLVLHDSTNLTPEDRVKQPALRKRIAAAYEAATFDLLDKLQDMAVPPEAQSKPADPAVEK